MKKDYKYERQKKENDKREKRKKVCGEMERNDQGHESEAEPFERFIKGKERGERNKSKHNMKQKGQ